MSIKELKALIKNEMTFFEKVVWMWEDLRDLTLTELRRIGLVKCPHDSTIGSVGSEYCFCLDCLKHVKNPDFEIEKEALNKK